NPLTNNLCSQCFNEFRGKNNVDSSEDTTVAAPSQKQTEPELPLSHLDSAEASAPMSTSMDIISEPVEPSQVPEEPSPALQEPSPVLEEPSLAPVLADQGLQQLPEPMQSIIHYNSAPVAPSLQTLSSLAPTERPAQTNKGRCFQCRVKIPLAQQAINKCYCGYVFCGKHKISEKHDCDFDYAKIGKELLSKANPKLNDKPRGGRSFTRLE
ncbi:zinc finger domain-containing protein, partial [Modicella reniformis]